MLIDIHGGPFIGLRDEIYPLRVGVRFTARFSESSQIIGTAVTVGLSAALPYPTSLVSIIAWAFHVLLPKNHDTYFAVQVCGLSLYTHVAKG